MGLHTFHSNVNFHHFVNIDDQDRLSTEEKEKNSCCHLARMMAACSKSHSIEDHLSDGPMVYPANAIDYRLRRTYKFFSFPLLLFFFFFFFFEAWEEL